MKYTLFFLFLFTIIGCLNFGDEEDYISDSKEAKDIIEFILETTVKDTIQNMHAYKNEQGIDPYYYTKFTIQENRNIEDFIDSTWIQINQDSNKTFSKKAPEWFTPSKIDNPIYFTKNTPGKNKELVYSKDTRICYLSLMTY